MRNDSREMLLLLLLLWLFLLVFSCFKEDSSFDPTKLLIHQLVDVECVENPAGNSQGAQMRRRCPGISIFSNAVEGPTYAFKILASILQWNILDRSWPVVGPCRPVSAAFAGADFTCNSCLEQFLKGGGRGGRPRISAFAHQAIQCRDPQIN